MKRRAGDLVMLETDRFLIRSIEREDVNDTFLSWLGSEDVMIGMNMPQRNMTIAQAIRWVMSFDNDRKFFFLVIDTASAKPIGFFTAHVDSHNVGETAVVIGDPDFLGQNVVVEARSAIIDFLFDVIGVSKVLGRPHGRNFASIFNYNALGFTCEAVLREQMRAVRTEERLDQLIYGMLAAEWRARKEG